MSWQQSQVAGEPPRSRALLWPCNRRHGIVIVMVWVVVALGALLGMAALTVDIGQLVIAAQVAQDVADAAALGAGRELPSHVAAQSVALSLVTANNESAGGFTASCSPDSGDITFWGANETIPDFGPLVPSTSPLPTLLPGCWACRGPRSRAVARWCVCPWAACPSAQCGSAMKLITCTDRNSSL